MTDLRQAAKIALEALCVAANDAVPNDINKQLEQAAEALRQALAQPEQEPVAWMKPSGLVSPYKHGNYQIPLYAAPPKPEYATEVVAVSENGIRTVKQTTIPKREWVGLTDEEIRDRRIVMTLKTIKGQT